MKSSPIAFYLAGAFYDWHSGVKLTNFVGVYWFHGCIMETWIDKDTGERAYRVV